MIDLAPTPKYSPREIRTIRKNTGMSRREFARFMNLSLSTITKWENGEKNPSGSALKLLYLIASKKVVTAL